MVSPDQLHRSRFFFLPPFSGIVEYNFIGKGKQTNKQNVTSVAEVKTPNLPFLRGLRPKSWTGACVCVLVHCVCLSHVCISMFNVLSSFIYSLFFLLRVPITLPCVLCVFPWKARRVYSSRSGFYKQKIAAAFPKLPLLLGLFFFC